MSRRKLTDQELLEILQNSDSEGDFDGDVDSDSYGWENISESDGEDQQEEIRTGNCSTCLNLYLYITEVEQYIYLDLKITKLHRIKNTKKNLFQKSHLFITYTVLPLQAIVMKVMI